MTIVFHLLLLSFAIDLSAANFQSKSERQAGRHHDSESDEADVMELTFDVDGEPVQLNLRRSDSIPHNPTTVLGHNGRFTYWNDPTTRLTAYVDELSRTSVVVESRQEEAIVTRRFRGNFERDGQLYSIEPVVGGLTSRSSAKSSRVVDIEGTQHIVSRVESARARHVHSTEDVGDKSLDDDEEMTRRSESDDINDLKSEVVGELLRQIRAKVLRIRDKRSKLTSRDDKKHYIVELLIVLDWSIYQRWFQMSQATNDYDKHQEAIGLIRHYFAQVASGIDIRYATIKEPDFSIRVHLVSYYIATTVQDSSWTEDSTLKIMYKNEPYTNMYKAIEKLEQWVAEITPIYTPFDHAVLFSGNSLYDGTIRPDGSPNSKSGLSNVEGICQLNRRVSINFEFGEYSTIQTGAHELGHNLGAQHDGSANECSGTAQFVMASAPAALQDSNFKNPFNFSPCSIRYFRNYLGKLTSSGKNCLLTHNASSIVVDNVYPGLVYSPDTQCEHFYGSGAYYCGGDIFTKDICSKLVCWLPQHKFCFAAAEQRAYVGTMCANRKWCMKGECRADPNAAAANETCVYGDIRSPVWIDDATPKTSCPEAGQQHPWKCYDSNFNQECCVTCPKIKHADKPGCEYGDRSPAYCKRGAKSDCYDESYRKTCCETCDKVKTPTLGCEYGDKASWCSTSIKDPAWQCYTQSALCCETCNKFKTTVPNCEYGDKVTWCATAGVTPNRCTPNDLGTNCCGTCSKLVPGGTYVTTPIPGASASCPNGDNPGLCGNIQPFQCYQVAQYCCVTCPKYKTTIQGCEYGDRAPWCSGFVKGPDQCKKPEMKQQCCKSCSAYRNLEQSSTAVDRVSSDRCRLDSDTEIMKMCRSSTGNHRHCLNCIHDLLQRLISSHSSDDDE